MQIETIDLLYRGVSRVIASYRVNLVDAAVVDGEFDPQAATGLEILRIVWSDRRHILKLSDQ